MTDEINTFKIIVEAYVKSGMAIDFDKIKKAIEEVKDSEIAKQQVALLYEIATSYRQKHFPSSIAKNSLWGSGAGLVLATLSYISQYGYVIPNPTFFARGAVPITLLGASLTPWAAHCLAEIQDPDPSKQKENKIADGLNKLHSLACKREIVLYQEKIEQSSSQRRLFRS